MRLNGARASSDLAAAILEVRIPVPPVVRGCVISPKWSPPDQTETLSSGFRQRLLNEGATAYLIYVHSSLRDFVVL